jgi:hypothetical protein
MWDLANIVVYIDCVLAKENTVNLEIDTPIADNKWKYMSGVQEMGQLEIKIPSKNTLKQVRFYSLFFP